MTNKNTDTILAIDPALRELGFAVLRGRRLVTAGVRALRLFPAHQRRKEARRLLRGWIEAHGVTTLVLERTHRHSVVWLDEVHRLALDLRRLARSRGLEVTVYAPQTIRKDLLGNGWATKADTAQAMAVEFPPLRIYLTQDRRWKERYFRNMFDAVALALHHQRAA